MQLMEELAAKGAEEMQKGKGTKVTGKEEEVRTI